MECPDCGFRATARQWHYAEAEGFACPVEFEPEPASPRRRWAWIDSRLVHAHVPAAVTR